jgi:hypothetical protein
MPAPVANVVMFAALGGWFSSAGIKKCSRHGKACRFKPRTLLNIFKGEAEVYRRPAEPDAVAAPGSEITPCRIS